MEIDNMRKYLCNSSRDLRKYFLIFSFHDNILNTGYSDKDKGQTFKKYILEMYIVKTKQQIYDKFTYLCISSFLYSTFILDNNNFRFSFRNNVINRYCKEDFTYD